LNTAKPIYLELLVCLILISVFSAIRFCSAQSGGGTIYVSPNKIELTAPPTQVGSTFNVTVKIGDYTRVAGWQAKLIFDKRYLNTTVANVKYASNFIFPDGSYPPIPSSVENVFANDTHAYAMMTTTTYGAVEYNGTDAGLMTVRFSVLTVPAVNESISSMLWLEPDDTWIIDTDINELPETLQDGSFIITGVSQPPPPPPSEPLLPIWAWILILFLVVLVSVIIIVYLKRR
jgi:hypothetical protein